MVECGLCFDHQGCIGDVPLAAERTTVNVIIIKQYLTGNSGKNKHGIWPEWHLLKGYRSYI
jgi:hypothetical protein